MFRRLVAVLFEVWHERRAASADGGGILRILLSLVENVLRGVVQVLVTEYLDESDARVVRLAQRSIVLLRQHEIPQARPGFELLDERPTRRRPALPHLH